MHPCPDNATHSATVMDFTHHARATPVRALYCGICNKAWLGMRRADSTTGLATLDLDVWTVAREQSLPPNVDVRRGAAGSDPE